MRVRGEGRGERSQRGLAKSLLTFILSEGNINVDCFLQVVDVSIQNNCTVAEIVSF